MNELLPHKRAALKRLLATGASLRTIAQVVGCSSNTVLRYKRMWRVAAECGCGQPAGHNGWCVVRLDYSPARRGWLKQRWRTRSTSAIRLTVDQAAKAASVLGHTLGLFVWSSASAASFAFAICRTCGKEVRVYGGQSQWERYYGWQRFAGGAVQARCFTQEQRAADEAARQEKRQWREGKRTLLELKKILRDQSHSHRIERD